MICSLTNISTVALLVDFDNGTEQMLQPQQHMFYNDSDKILTPPTWELVELGLLEDKDVESIWRCVKSGLHNWALEGF